MRKQLILILFSLSVSAFAGTAFLKYDYVTGITRQCVYDYLGNEYRITIAAHSLCPLTIEVE